MNRGEYIRTPHWRSVRAWAIERAGYHCQINRLHRKNLEVHHNSYDRVGAEQPEDLIVLCDECHELYKDRMPHKADDEQIEICTPSGLVPDHIFDMLSSSRHKKSGAA